MRDILLAVVSTRRYETAQPKAADTVGVSRIAVSWRFIEAIAAQLIELGERSLAALENLLRQLIGRRLDASLSYLLVIDGSPALRSAIDEMFGQRRPLSGRTVAHSLTRGSTWLILPIAFRIPHLSFLLRAALRRRQIPSPPTRIRGDLQARSISQTSAALNGPSQ
jgi:hypothetical protein